MSLARLEDNRLIERSAVGLVILANEDSQEGGFFRNLHLSISFRSQVNCAIDPRRRPLRHQRYSRWAPVALYEQATILTDHAVDRPHSSHLIAPTRWRGCQRNYFHSRAMKPLQRTVSPSR